MRNGRPQNTTIMKLHHQIGIIALFGITACTKAPDTAAANKHLDERLQKMEAQLSRIESALEGSTKAVQAAPPKEQIKIYVSGPVAKPGQYSVDKDISLLAAIAVAGGPTEYADLNKIKIQRPGQEDQIIPDKSAFKDVILADGDVVVVPQSFW